MATYRKKLIEVALPLLAINSASAREKSIRNGHPSTLHLWWARRPLAATRAVLFGQLVDDPGSWPSRFPTEAAQQRERRRLFGLIEELVQWKNTTNSRVINAARLEIARSIAWGRRSDGKADDRDENLLREAPSPAVVNAFLADVAPTVHDPFAGGGSIPLEAQRLGLPTLATDLNPVAVLINKALIELPARFAGHPPVSRGLGGHQRKSWPGASGLAADVRHYGKWMRDEAFRRVGKLYPQVELPTEHGGGKETVIAWIWARTVPSPNPAYRGAQVPLISTYWLSKKRGKTAWLEPIIDRANRSWRFAVRTAVPAEPKVVAAGTKIGRANFRCLLSGEPILPPYIRAEGKAGRLGERLIAIVTKRGRKRIYLAARQDHEELAIDIEEPGFVPVANLPTQALGFRVQNYGLTRHRDLYTKRQITLLSTFAELARHVPEKVLEDAGSRSDELTEYADAVGVYAALSASKAARFSTTLSYWRADEGKFSRAYGRQTVQMTWDFAETNPFSGTGGDILGLCAGTADVLEASAVSLPAADVAVRQADAAAPRADSGLRVTCTDPPYYDNISYADLADCFYVWLRHAAGAVVPHLMRTMLTPKNDEIIADPSRRTDGESAKSFFERRIREAMDEVHQSAVPDVPTAIYYAFKQEEVGAQGSASTGWETFLQALVAAGFMITATVPVRTEGPTRMRAMGSNALASSVVLVCRPLPDGAPSSTRAEFRRLLRRELPGALANLKRGNIAPVDVAQASIGPGMAIFTRHQAVLEPDGVPMTVRTALQLINHALDEALTENEGELDSDTRFAVTWFEEHEFQVGPFGQAETLAKARNVSVAGVVQSGVLHSAAGKVRLLRRGELPEGWSPAEDDRVAVWEAAQHLIKRLARGGEREAATLLAQLGPLAEPARDLAYRLFQTCERKGWAEEARAYNLLVVAWPELVRLATEIPPTTNRQTEIF